MSGVCCLYNYKQVEAQIARVSEFFMVYQNLSFTYGFIFLIIAVFDILYTFQTPF